MTACKTYNEQVKISETKYENMEKARIEVREKTEIYEWAENTYLRSRTSEELVSSYKDPEERLSEINERYRKRELALNVLKEIKDGKNNENDKSNEYKEYENSLSAYEKEVREYYNLLKKANEISQKVRRQENLVAGLEAEKENALSKLVSRVDADKKIKLHDFFKKSIVPTKKDEGWTFKLSENKNSEKLEEYFAETVEVTDVYGNKIKKKKAQLDAEEWLEKMLSNEDDDYFYKVILAANYYCNIPDADSKYESLTIAKKESKKIFGKINYAGIINIYQDEKCPLPGLNRKGKVHGYEMRNRYRNILISNLKDIYESVSKEDIVKYLIYKDAFLEGSSNYAKGRYTVAADNYIHKVLYKNLDDEIKKSYGLEDMLNDTLHDPIDALTAGISTYVKTKNYKELCEYSDYNIKPKIKTYNTKYVKEKEKNSENLTVYSNLKKKYEAESQKLSTMLYDYDKMLKDAGIASSEDISKIKSEKKITDVFGALDAIADAKLGKARDAKKSLDQNFEKIREGQKKEGENFSEAVLALEKSEEADENERIRELKEAARKAFGKYSASSKKHYEKLHEFYSGFDLEGEGGNFIMQALAENSILAGNAGSKHVLELKNYDLNLNRHDLAEQRNNWKNMMDLVIVAGRNEWERGQKQLVSDRKNWQKEFSDSAEKNLKVWNENYQEFLDDKALWVENQYLMASEGKWLENTDGRHTDMSKILEESLAKSKLGQISCMEIEKLKGGNENYVSTLFDSSFTSHLISFSSEMVEKAGSLGKESFTLSGIDTDREMTIENLMIESKNMAKDYIESAVKLSELQAKIQLEKT
ncbi:MAG: hypothetical protein K5839_07235, partial [Treponemataceae bacterium]|nr:hypothetical protein [Treponemataceae bacterium]